MQRVSVVTLAFVLGLVPLIPTDAAGQEPPKPADAAKGSDRAAESRTPTALRVQLVIARYQGEKKVGSVPYSFLVTTGERSAKLRMGVEVPIPVTKVEKDSPITSYHYRAVGTNIDCDAEALGGGLFKLRLNLESSSVYSTPEGRPPASPADTPMAQDQPLFRTLNVSLNPVLRDGQSVQTVVSTDPVTGEVVKIDVSLSMVK